MGTKSEIFDRYHIIGGEYRKNCGDLDREHWFYYVIKKYTSIFTNECVVLHFAPEKRVLEKIIKKNLACQYFTADIRKGRARYVVDMTDIQFEDEKFDYVIANHVLEHIVDEELAINQLKRVLKPDGRIILSFPICIDRDTYEDKAIINEEERLNSYGQKDHVRLYGHDLKKHFEKYGLQIEIYSPSNYFEEADIKEFGFIPEDCIMICKKP